MSNPEEGQGEPSMEEILASIRRIISEDDPAEGEGEAQAEPEAPAAEEEAQEEPLELTEEVTDDTPKAEAEAPEEPEPEPEPEPEQETPEPEAPVELVAEDESPEPDVPPEPPAVPSDTLVEPDIAAAASASIANIVGQIGMENRVSPGGAVHRTLEEVVRDALMPVLKTWLDRHLPSLVERIVREEIKKMVRRAEDS